MKLNLVTQDFMMLSFSYKMLQFFLLTICEDKMCLIMKLAIEQREFV